MLHNLLQVLQRRDTHPLCLKVETIPNLLPPGMQCCHPLPPQLSRLKRKQPVPQLWPESMHPGLQDLCSQCDLCPLHTPNPPPLFLSKPPLKPKFHYNNVDTPHSK